MSLTFKNVKIAITLPSGETLESEGFDDDSDLEAIRLALRKAQAPDLPAAAFLPPVRTIPHAVRFLCQRWHLFA